MCIDEWQEKSIDGHTGSSEKFMELKAAWHKYISVHYRISKILAAEYVLSNHIVSAD